MVSCVLALRWLAVQVGGLALFTILVGASVAAIAVAGAALLTAAAVVVAAAALIWLIVWTFRRARSDGLPAAPLLLRPPPVVFLAMFAIVTFYFFLASLPTDRVLVAVSALIFIGLVLLAVGARSGTAGWTKAGGWVTLAFAVLAWYHAAADIINFTFKRQVLPVGHLPA